MQWFTRLFARRPLVATPTNRPEAPAPKPALLRMQNGEPVTGGQLVAFFALSDEEQLEEFKR